MEGLSNFGACVTNLLSLTSRAKAWTVLVFAGGWLASFP